MRWVLHCASWLMRPEIAHYVVQTAQELADLLGISLAQVHEEKKTPNQQASFFPFFCSFSSIR
ncbi:hypothetical protein KSF_088020 [Reticulibacter mediterranei]|uniref:Uncharacterized protein n=1 Tax=Reticulibacter mediterranei TaxID=2778369 RepID=A0A8J3N561_9CHLR|nr:hypothetical protein KSF_088020 [Reticulibacter mediterranei]